PSGLCHEPAFGGCPMDLRLGEKEEAFREEVRAFLREHLPEGANGDQRPRLSPEEEHQRGVTFNRELARKGWIAPAWPIEYGGLGAGIFQQIVFNEELGYAGAPDSGLRGFGVSMLGPTLIVHGTEEQKREYLPRITSGEHIWCQGYSEPAAGSDLASL